MAIERISYSNISNSTANSGTVAITVPADATLAVLMLSGYNGTTNYFTGGTDPTINSVTMSQITGTDGDTGKWMGAIFYLVNPATGSQTLAWDWAGTGTGDQANIFVMAYYKGVDTADLVRDTFGGQFGNNPYASDTLTAASGDLIIACASGFFDGAESHSWTGATTVASFNPNAYANLVFAEASPTGDQSVTYTGNMNDGALGCLVLKADAGGGGGGLVSSLCLLGVGP